MTRAYYAAHKDSILAQQRVYRDSKPPGYASEKTRKWRLANPEKFKKLRHRIKARIRATRPWIALGRAVVSVAIRSRGFTKHSRTVDILGCDWLTFKAWIEQQFLEGMCWENYGRWHADHMIPISTAETEAEGVLLNHYTNFRPLWEHDNLSKKNSTAELSCPWPRQ